jgi:4-hydroxybenzoate polyprenyltransferase
MLLSLLQLARPLLLPFVLFLPVVGFGWGHWDHALALGDDEPRRLFLVLAAWAFLQSGTLWLNAALDRDDGEVLLGQPAPIPPGIVPLGLFALAVAVGLAWQVRPAAGLVALACAALAVLYSHPRAALKGHPLAGPLINGVGYGLLSPLAGWLVVAVPAGARTVLVWLLGGLGVLGCYFAAQAFQGEEDVRRGYRTLVATHGPRATLLAARLCIGTGMLGGLALTLFGWLPRLCLPAFLLGWWVDAWLRRWANEPAGGSERWARGMAWRLLLAGAAAVGLAYIDYFIDLAGDGPVAGAATARGHPPAIQEP